MNLHADAALSLKGRRQPCRAVVDRERTVTQAAEAAGVSVRCARKWVGRYRTEGQAGPRDRSSAPHQIPHATSQQRVAVIAALGGWAYGAIYRSSTERADGWLWHYNHHRRHSALGHQPPIARLNERHQP